MKATPPSSLAVPWFTVCLVALICVVAALPLELAIYDRERPDEWWRFGTSWLMHYDLAHLASNVAVLAVLGTCVEREISPQFMLWLLSGSIVLCTGLLHVALPHYALYAGISPMSYALLGSMIVLVWQWRPVAGVGLLVAAIVAQYHSWAGGGLISSMSVRPVWELHGLAFVIGILAAICWRASRLPAMAATQAQIGADQLTKMAADTPAA